MADQGGIIVDAVRDQKTHMMLPVSLRQRFEIMVNTKGLFAVQQHTKNQTYVITKYLLYVFETTSSKPKIRQVIVINAINGITSTFVFDDGEAAEGFDHIRHIVLREKIGNYTAIRFDI